MADEPVYYAKGNTVHKRPVRTPKDGGGATISIGFPVCTMTDFVGAEGAQFVADALIAAEAAHRGCMCPYCNPQQQVAQDARPEWYDDAVRLAQSGRRFYHVPTCAVQGAVIEGCTCGAASANKVLARMAAPLQPQN